MKAYLLFAGHNYYPSGGIDDYRDAYDTQPEAVAAGEEMLRDGTHDWWQVVEHATMVEVDSGFR